MSFWKNVSAPLLMVGLASPMLVNCDLLGAIPGMDCPALKDGNFAALKFSGGAEVDAKLKGFLEAAYSVDKLAIEMEAGLIASCGELGTAIGMGDAELKAEAGGGEGAKKVCAAVAAKITATLKANAEASLSIEIGEPSCSADIDAMMKCYGECGIEVDPGGIEASCEGGEVSGKCGGSCEGTCKVEAGAACEGKCGGSCKGECDGECAAKNAEGGCEGKCEGTCKGECSATCEVTGGGECSGTCSGGCDVKMEAPKCSGEFKPPEVSADCQMNCSAKTAASVSCEPPSVDIKIEGEAGAELEALVDGLKVALPKIVNIQIGMGKRLVGQVEALVEAGAALPEIAASAGLQAVGCIAGAVDMTIGASASISVNVEASASISGSASGEAEGEAEGEAG